MTPSILAQADPVSRACGEGSNIACRTVFDWTGNATLARVADFLFGPPLRIALIVLGAFVAIGLINAAVGRFTGRLRRRAEEEGGPASARAATRTDTLSGVLKAIGAVVVWIVVALTVLGEIGLDLAPLIAGAGILGVAIGFGAQNLVSDFLSGLFMLIEDQYGIGDFVDLGEASGIVEGMGLRTTRLRDVNGMLWHVRNGEVVRTGNGSHTWARAVLDVGVAYGADLRKAQDVVLRVAEETRQDPEQGDKFLDRPEIWGIQSLDADSVAIRLAVKTTPGTQWGLARELRLRIKEALDAEGIEIPFPQRTVWLRTEAETTQAPLRVTTEDGGSDA